MRINRTSVRPAPVTHGGVQAARISVTDQLRRSVYSNFLWEDEFYESGVKIADRISSLAVKVPPQKLAEIAYTARSEMNLRHVPLLLLKTLAKTGAGEPGLVSNAIANTIQRADELAEFLAIYWKDQPNAPLSNGVKKGLAKALRKFDEYQLAKYNRDGDVKLRDVLFLTHAKPRDIDQEATFKRLAEKQLQTPDTWEVALSGGANKRETFERLIREGNLGYLALLRNLRNMVQAGVDEDLVRQAILARKNGAHRVLPFRFVAAARHARTFEPELDKALLAGLDELPQFSGKTIILVDVSGSMDRPLSAKSDLTRMDAAATLASIFPGNADTFSFSNWMREVPPRRGMAGVDAIIGSQNHGGTDLAGAITAANSLSHKAKRLIVITDEQATSGRVPLPAFEKAYMINVASNQNGVGYGGPWVHIDGFSENVLKFIQAHESFVAEVEYEGQGLA